MPFPTRPRAGLACALSTLLLLALPPASLAQNDPDPLAWREAATRADLVEYLETWIDGATDLPRRATPASIRLISEPQARNLAGQNAAHHGGRPRGFYDPDSTTIYLVRPWHPRNPQDVSVLLHELVHHRQTTARHWVCPGAQELPAYKLQDAWLQGMGLKANVNWIAVVLEAGCSRRDHHPD